MRRLQHWRMERHIRRAVRSLDAELERLLNPTRSPAPAAPWLWLAALSLGPVDLPKW